MTAETETSGLFVPGTSAASARGRARARMTFAVAAAVVAHVGLLAATLVTLDRSFGDGGGRIDAVEVELIDSAVLDNRAPVTAAANDTRAAEHLAAVIGNAAEDIAAQPASQQASATPSPTAEAIMPESSKPATEPLVVPEPPQASTATASEASRPAQVEATAGGETASGTADQPIATSAKAAASPGAKAAYRQSVIAALARNQPRGQGRAGVVRVVFTISGDGAVGATEISETSGNADLDRHAVEAVRRTRFAPLPAGLTAADATFAMRYTFR